MRLIALRLAIGLGAIPTAARPAAPTALVNLVKPTFAGVLPQGQTVTIDPGQWNGLPSPNFEYQVKRNGIVVAARANGQYTFTAADAAAGAVALVPVVSTTNDVDTTTATGDSVTIATPLAISGTPPQATVGVRLAFWPRQDRDHHVVQRDLTRPDAATVQDQL